MNQPKNTAVLNIILLFSIFSLLIAYFIQYILGYKPCNLCLIERVPYILTIIIIILNLIINKFEKIFIILLSIIFTVATFVSFYHFGIEQGVFSESLVCNLSNESNNLSKEDLLKQLSEKIISCKEVSFRVFGLSLATINAFISLILAAITTKLFLSYEKK